MSEDTHKSENEELSDAEMTEAFNAGAFTEEEEGRIIFHAPSLMGSLRLDAQPVGRALHHPWSYYLLRPETPPENEGKIIVEKAAAPVGVVVLPEQVKGKRLLHRKYAGDKVRINGVDYLLIEAQHALLWLEDTDKVEAD